MVCYASVICNSVEADSVVALAHANDHDFANTSAAS